MVESTLSIIILFLYLNNDIIKALEGGEIVVEEKDSWYEKRKYPQGIRINYNASVYAEMAVEAYKR